jgi:hypothetical protein
MTLWRQKAYRDCFLLFMTKESLQGILSFVFCSNEWVELFMPENAG